jgi:CRP-like cAMP-binding protein
MNQVRPNALLATLNDADNALLLKNLVEFSAERHTILQMAGRPTEHVYFPVKGMISFLTVMQNGEAIETACVGFDSAAGYNTALSGRNSNCQLIVQLAMKSRRITSAQFRQAYEHSAGVRHMIHIANELLVEQTQQTAACQALHMAEQRLARWLLQTHDYAGQGVLDLTQEFVAEMLGVRRTTVSLVATALQSEKLITIRRGQVTILNREGLEQRSCECYGTVMKHRNGHPALKPVAVSPQ